MSVALMLNDAPTPPPAPAPQGQIERVIWHVYRTPPGYPVPFLVVRWRATPGQARAYCDEPVPAAGLAAARRLIPLGLVRFVAKARKGDYLLEVWKEPKAKEPRR